MPTIRSEFTYHQFEEVLQALAYKTALETMQTMKCKQATIKTKGKELTLLETDNWIFKFYSKRVSFSPVELRKSEYSSGGYHTWPKWNCIIEEKMYSDSPHSSKIHFDVNDNENESEKRKLIMEFIDMVMEGVKPVHRFSLAAKAVATKS